MQRAEKSIVKMAGKERIDLMHPYLKQKDTI